MACIHCKIEGKVQGVFFRASTQTQAMQHQIRGWVRNCSDGRVELMACGENNALEALEAWLWQGPRYAAVSRVSCERVTDAEFDIPDDFVIL